ncbi:MAG: hypothetical protein IKO03_14610 [Lachnospiraceae bacterium]|nr:hypothetical protein [Lachnospiraceae bacterium]
MEGNSKKIFSTLLLSVGVLFIVVSGGIFVSQTWQYLPDAIKKLCLVVVTAAFFAGSVWTERKSLGKASTALYYLGVCFTGFSVMGLLLMTDAEKSMMLFLSLAAMSVPMLWRFWKEKRVIDFILQVLLCDGMILCLANSFGGAAGSSVALLSTTVLSMLMAGLIAYCHQELPEEQNIITVASLVYIFHTMISLPWTLLELFIESNFIFLVFPVLMILGSITVLYLTYNKLVVLRVVQSFLLLYALLTFAVALFKNVFIEYGWTEIAYSVFGAFLIGLILMVLLDRKELLFANVMLMGLYSLIQVAMYVILKGVAREELCCFPYAIALAIALLAWKYFKDPDVSWKTIGKFALLFSGIGLNGVIAFFLPAYARDYAVLFLVALYFLTISFCMDDFRGMNGLKALFQTMSLLVALITVLKTPIFPTTFLEEETGRLLVNFQLEYICIFLGLGIVLLGIIWYDIFEEIRISQLIGTCLLLAVLLFHNLMVPALANVLFLGIAALLMLVLATLLKQKAYALAAALTLTIIALYLTREVWLSIAWWVYLFVAGVGLVIFAIKKEKAEK